MFMKAFASCEARCSLNPATLLSAPHLQTIHSPIHLVQTISHLPVQSESICRVSSKNVHTPHPRVNLTNHLGLLVLLCLRFTSLLLPAAPSLLCTSLQQVGPGLPAATLSPLIFLPEARVMMSLWSSQSLSDSFCRWLQFSLFHLVSMLVSATPSHPRTQLLVLLARLLLSSSA